MVSVQRQGLETLTDTTCALSKGFCKSLRKQTENATSLLHEVAECVDPEDLMKSIYHLGKHQGNEPFNFYGIFITPYICRYCIVFNSYMTSIVILI